MLQFIFMVSKKALTSNTALSFNQSMPGKDLGLKGGGKGAEGSGRVIWKIVRISELKAGYAPSWKKRLLIFPVSDEPDDQTGGGRSAR